MVTAIPIILIDIVWMVTEPITFLERIYVIRLAGNISIVVFITLIILSTLQAIIKVTDKNEHEDN